jgi:ATP-dependent protease HslVU (ClpYQ) peptidase subunit
MSCIAAVVENNKVHMASDSLASSMESHETLNYAAGKIFVSGQFVLGVAGSFRLMQVIRYSFKPPVYTVGADLMAYMVLNFEPALHKLVKAMELDETALAESHVVVGLDGRLFILDTDRHVGEITGGYAAIGSGAAVANGALRTSRGLGLDTTERLRIALEAAEYHDATVRAPFYFLSEPGVTGAKTALQASKQASRRSTRKARGEPAGAGSMNA